MPKTDNVSVGKPRVAGAIFRAPLGTALPTDAASELAAAYEDLGYASDDGVKNNNSAETDDVYAWGKTPVANILTDKPDEWTVKLLESLNPNVLTTVYGSANVTVDETDKTIKIAASSELPDDAVYIIDMALKGGALKRVVIPHGSIGSVGEIVYKDDEPIGYEVTIKAMDDGTGHTHYEYIKLPST